MIKIYAKKFSATNNITEKSFEISTSMIDFGTELNCGAESASAYILKI